MKRFLLMILLLCLPAHAAIEGGVAKSGAGNSVIDLDSGDPVAGAKVSLPKQGYSTYTDGSGAFELGARVNNQTVLSVEKEGYRPYSMTIDKNTASKPIVMGIEKSNPTDIVLDVGLFHLGDDNFSDNSAGAGNFRAKSVGPFYTKAFKIGAAALTAENYLIIGSVIGLDTMMARSMGQNKILHSYSSPAEIFFNGNKIGELHINGDSQRVKLPKNLIRPDNANEITVKTGKNLMQTSYVDYDDIEVMNISVQSD